MTKGPFAQYNTYDHFELFVGRHSLAFIEVNVLSCMEDSLEDKSAIFITQCQRSQNAAVVEGNLDKITLLYLFRISLFTKMKIYLQNYYEHVIKIKMYYHKSTKIRKILKAKNDTD